MENRWTKNFSLRIPLSSLVNLTTSRYAWERMRSYRRGFWPSVIILRFLVFVRVSRFLRHFTYFQDPPPPPSPTKQANKQTKFDVSLFWERFRRLICHFFTEERKRERRGGRWPGGQGFFWFPFPFTPGTETRGVLRYWCFLIFFWYRSAFEMLTSMTVGSTKGCTSNTSHSGKPNSPRLKPWKTLYHRSSMKRIQKYLALIAWNKNSWTGSILAASLFNWWAVKRTVIRSPVVKEWLQRYAWHVLADCVMNVDTSYVTHGWHTLHELFEVWRS